MQRLLREKIGRRKFLQGGSIFAIAMTALQFATLSGWGCSGNLQKSAENSPGTNLSHAPWKITIVSDTEPGEPLIISGTIYAPDGRTPLPGINLFVYQTDATGRYSTSGGDNRNTRIHGLMKSDAEGRYEFRTIKPASYPGSTVPAHIHAYVSGQEYPEYWIDEYWFEGDPFVTSQMRSQVMAPGNFSPIVGLKRDADGVWRGVRDIKVERCLRNCTGR